MTKPNLPATPSITELNASPKPKNWLLIGVFVLLTISLSTTGFLAYQNFQLKKQFQQAQITPTLTSGVVVATPTPNLTTNWKTYRNETITFKFPSSWEEKPVLIRGSGYTQEFNDPQNKYILTFLSSGNYNQVTGKPYANIDEYINMPYKVKAVTIDGQDGRQPLPRAGSENINSVMFFSKDSRDIYALELQTGNTLMDINEADAKEGQRLFNQILSTFKFLDQDQGDNTANWQTYRNQQFKFLIKYPENWDEETVVSSGWLRFLSPNKKNYFSVEAGSKGGISGTETIENYCDSRNKSQPLGVLERHNILADNVPAVYCVDRSDEKTMPVYFLAQKDNLQYEIRGNFEKQDTKANLELFNQILSTFKFLD